jgi:hypothetical protein
MGGIAVDPGASAQTAPQAGCITMANTTPMAM